MTEDESRNWIEERFGATATDTLSTFLHFVITENERQNLIAPSTVSTIWNRHALDSAQLLKWDRPGHWVDIGTGGGFPGMVIACLRQSQLTLVEPRHRRAEFLRATAERLQLRHVAVLQMKAEAVVTSADIISARAVAPVEKLLTLGKCCASSGTRWLLPRGRGLNDNVLVPPNWMGTFHVEQSLTDAESAILILDGRGER